MVLFPTPSVPRKRITLPQPKAALLVVFLAVSIIADNSGERGREWGWMF
jgi:hypothetical protein